MFYKIIKGKEYLSSGKNSTNIISFPTKYDTTRTSANI